MKRRATVVADGLWFSDGKNRGGNLAERSMCTQTVGNLERGADGFSRSWTRTAVANRRES